MQVEQWTRIANIRQRLCFADSFGRKKYSFFKQQNEQIMPKPLQSHRTVCGFHMMYAAFHLFRFRQEEIRSVHYANASSFEGNHMLYFNFFHVNVQVLQCVC